MFTHGRSVCWSVIISSFTFHVSIGILYFHTWSVGWSVCFQARECSQLNFYIGFMCGSLLYTVFEESQNDFNVPAEIVQGVQEKLCFFTIHCNPSITPPSPTSV